jgi:CheY-like chemotaxis protein
MEEMNKVFRKIEETIRKSSQKVLIVEENARHASALSYFLSSYDIGLSVENNVEDSVKALYSDKVDCVILDIAAFRGKEYEIVESIKSNEGLENLPIIIFTEHSLSTSEELKIKQYADSIVVKTAHSYQRILDEVGLFLHLVAEKNNTEETKSKTLGSLTEVLSGKKVLITDDDARNIFSLTKALEKYKVEVILAMDGKQALEQIDKNPDIDVVLMDMMMPEMDGYTLTAEIRSNPELKGLHVILHTSLSGVFNHAMVQKVGADNFIAKFHPDELAKAVQDAM